MSTLSCCAVLTHSVHMCTQLYTYTVWSWGNQEKIPHHFCPLLLLLVLLLLPSHFWLSILIRPQGKQPDWTEHEEDNPCSLCACGDKAWERFWQCVCFIIKSAWLRDSLSVGPRWLDCNLSLRLHISLSLTFLLLPCDRQTSLLDINLYASVHSCTDNSGSWAVLLLNWTVNRCSRNIILPD